MNPSFRKDLCFYFKNSQGGTLFSAKEFAKMPTSNEYGKDEDNGVVSNRKNFKISETYSNDDFLDFNLNRLASQCVFLSIKNNTMQSPFTRYYI